MLIKVPHLSSFLCVFLFFFYIYIYICLTVLSYKEGFSGTKGVIIRTYKQWTKEHDTKTTLTTETGMSIYRKKSVQ
jgi:hypothetical protein